MGSTAVELEQRETVLEIECNERRGTVTRVVKPTRLSVARLKFLWEKLKEFDVLFNDFVRDDPQAFFEHFLTVGDDGQIYPTGILYDVDDVGILFLNNIRPLDSGQVHFVFWDRVYSGRENLCREMSRYVIQKFKLHRLYVETPLYAKLSIKFMQRIGFVNEGRKRQAILYKGDWVDVMLFSMLIEDFDEEVLKGGSPHWLNKRRVCFKCGETFRQSEVEKEIANGS